MDASMLKKFQDNHIALWNERDPEKREQLIGTIYSNDIKMYDKDFVLSGTNEVLSFIGKLLADDPNFTFRALQPMQATQDGARLFWSIQTSGPMVTGMDFFELTNGKVQKLYVFMDEAE